MSGWFPSAKRMPSKKTHPQCWGLKMESSMEQANLVLLRDIGTGEGVPGVDGATRNRKSAGNNEHPTWGSDSSFGGTHQGARQTKKNTKSASQNSSWNLPSAQDQGQHSTTPHPPTAFLLVGAPRPEHPEVFQRENEKMSPMVLT